MYLKIEQFGVRSFKFQGRNILNQLKDLDIYTTSKTKWTFMKKLKGELLDLYPDSLRK